MAQLFRTEALNKIANPDQLDQSLRLIRARHRLGYGFVLAVVIAALTWTLVATAPVDVSGSGILLSPTGVTTLTATGSGQVAEILAEIGEHVTQGQPIVRLAMPARLDKLQEAHTEAKADALLYQALKQEFEAQDRAADELLGELGGAIADRVASLDALRTTLLARRDGEARLNQKGVVSGVQLYSTEEQLATTNNDLASARNQLVQIKLEQQKERDSRRQQLAQQRIKADISQLRATALQNEYDRDRQVLSTVPGIVAQIDVDFDQQIQVGQAIAHLIPDDPDDRDTLTAFAYIRASDGKKVEVGMKARVSPSTVKPELDGYARGAVIMVSPIPGNRASLMRILGNEVLVEQLLQEGAPIEVKIKLEEDPNTPSGYAWTSGRGPKIELQPGTLATTKIAVERIHLISLLLPAMDYVYGWIGNR